MNQEEKSPDESIGLDDEARVVEVVKTSVFGLWRCRAASARCLRS